MSTRTRNGRRLQGRDRQTARRNLPYGRSYIARDPDGHPWFLTTPPAER